MCLLFIVVFWHSSISGFYVIVDRNQNSWQEHYFVFEFLFSYNVTNSDSVNLHYGYLICKLNSGTLFTNFKAWASFLDVSKFIPFKCKDVIEIELSTLNYIQNQPFPRKSCKTMTLFMLGKRNNFFSADHSSFAYPAHPLGCRHTANWKKGYLRLSFTTVTVFIDSVQLRSWQLTAFWVSSIIQLCCNSNGGKQTEGGRHPVAWCACEWKYNLRPLVWIIMQCVATNSQNGRWASLVISGLEIDASCFLVAEGTQPVAFPNSHQVHLKCVTNPFWLITQQLLASDSFNCHHPSTKPHALWISARHVCNAILADVKRIPRSQHVFHCYTFDVVTIFLLCGSKLLVRRQLAFSGHWRRDSYLSSWRFCLNNKSTLYFELTLQG